MKSSIIRIRRRGEISVVKESNEELEKGGGEMKTRIVKTLDAVGI